MQYKYLTVHQVPTYVCAFICTLYVMCESSIGVYIYSTFVCAVFIVYTHGPHNPLYTQPVCSIVLSYSHC